MAAAALASPAPYDADGLDWFAGMGEDNVVEFSAALNGREGLEQFVEAVAPGLLSADTESLIQVWSSVLSPIDVEVLTEDIAEWMLNSSREGSKERTDGWIDDDVAYTTPWGFELSQIRIPVMVMQGEHDRFVPYSHGKWLVSKVPHVDARLSADDGHISLGVRRIPEVHAWLLSKMM